MSLSRTPAQTAGPYLAIGLAWEDGPFVVPQDTPGAVWIRGRLLDGAGDPVPDGALEIWGADPEGRFAHPGDAGSTTTFRGFGRCMTAADGGFRFLTRKPGVVRMSDGRPQAPHLDAIVHARGILTRLVTRIYFADEAAANAADPVLGAIADPDARRTLLATPASDGYTIDIHLQGPSETIFFDR